jgi:SnoaL-like polyketide cyclase
MLQADEARKALTKLPARRNRRLGTYMMTVSVADRRRARETTIWLHDVHGDPAKGKEKREIRKELGYDKEKGEVGEFGEGAMDPAEMAAGDDSVKMMLENLEVVVTFDDVAHRGMPMRYLEGLSDIHFAARAQTTKDRTVITRWEVLGMHTADLLGVPATGREVTLEGMTLIKFDEAPNPDGPGRVSRAVEEWTYWDVPAVAKQIGA